MNKQKALRLARKWAQGHVCSLRDGEAEEYHSMFAAMLEEYMSNEALTPRECERIMGMPDDWTKVPYRGKPADECPDGPRYRAIGNSMAVPVMRWIGERIQEVCHEEDQVPVPEGD